MTLFKMVNGEQVELSPEEITEYEAREAAAAAEAPERLKAAIVTATQAALDAFAATRSYSGIMSACTYVSSTNPTFAAEGAYCVELRDLTWAKLYEMLAEVQAGTRLIPSGYADIAGELPVTTAEWPSGGGA
jgi:hypothetical protein